MNTKMSIASKRMDNHCFRDLTQRPKLDLDKKWIMTRDQHNIRKVKTHDANFCLQDSLFEKSVYWYIMLVIFKFC